jgi:hypothetical protein
LLDLLTCQPPYFRTCHHHLRPRHLGCAAWSQGTQICHPLNERRRQTLHMFYFPTDSHLDPTKRHPVHPTRPSPIRFPSLVLHPRQTSGPPLAPNAVVTDVTRALSPTTLSSRSVPSRPELFCNAHWAPCFGRMMTFHRKKEDGCRHFLWRETAHAQQTHQAALFPSHQAPRQPARDDAARVPARGCALSLARFFDAFLRMCLVPEQRIYRT